MTLQAMAETDKTPSMRLLETLDPLGRDIDMIIADAIRKRGTLTGAADELQITKGALSQWIARRGGLLETRVRFPGSEKKD